MSEEKKPTEAQPQPSRSNPVNQHQLYQSKISGLEAQLVLLLMNTVMILELDTGTYGQLLAPNAASMKTWPDLVGLTAAEAEKKIKEERPGAHVQVVPPNSFVTMDFRNNRVRLYVDSSGKVERTPSIG